MGNSKKAVVRPYFFPSNLHISFAILFSLWNEMDRWFDRELFSQFTSTWNFLWSFSLIAVSFCGVCRTFSWSLHRRKPNKKIFFGTFVYSILISFIRICALCVCESRLNFLICLCMWQVVLFFFLVSTPYRRPSSFVILIIHFLPFYIFCISLSVDR